MNIIALLAAWLAGIFGRKLTPSELLAEMAKPIPATGLRRGTLRAVPPGVDREAYRKVQRSVRKFQQRIEAGKMTEAEALKQLGISVDG